MVDLLLITSCIAPPLQGDLKLIDSTERYEQTVNCLKFYVNCGAFKKILICDSSNYQFNDNEIIEYASKKGIDIEALSFLQNIERVKQLGKGYGEGEIMEYIVRNSKLFNSSTSFIKITGRLIVSNIVSIKEQLRDNTIYFNYIESKKIGCVDTRVYSMPTDVYKHYFIYGYKKVNDNLKISYEYVFTDILKKNHLIFTYFPYVPILQGISGTGNIPYHQDFIYKTKVVLTKMGLMNNRLSGYLLLGLYALKKGKNNLI